MNSLYHMAGFTILYTLVSVGGEANNFWDKLGIFISGLLTILVLVSFLLFNGDRAKD
ncbi:MAG: hypothetical protein ACLFVP_09540 [Candidatus Bathyarchaeia archaeon]